MRSSGRPSAAQLEFRRRFRAAIACGSARSAAGCGMMGGMTAQPVDDYDPDDPVEILRVLPGGFHGQFLAEYDAAVADARRPEQYRELHHLLRLWRLRAVAYADPGYAGRLAVMQETARGLAGRTGRRSRMSSRTGMRRSRPPAPACGRVSYRFQFEGQALVQLKGLPQVIFDVLAERVTDLVREPWDADLMMPGEDPACGQASFGRGYGLLSFQVNEGC